MVSTESPVPTISPESLRLPTTLIPVHYKLFMWPWIYPLAGSTEADPESFQNFGEVTIKVLCEEATDEIILHSRNLKHYEEKIAVTTESGVTIGIKQIR